jgi:hypothetical protein
MTIDRQIRGRNRILQMLVHAVILAGALGARAQVSTATLSGTVEDGSGAVVSGASVTLMDESKVYTRTATTNAEGYFTFAALPPSTYAVEIKRQGFESFVEHHIHLSPGDMRSLSQLDLKVGESKVTVTVTATVSGVPLDTGTLATTISSAELEKLSIQGRDATELLKILPGFAINSQGASNSTYDPSIVTPQGATLNASYISNGTGRESFAARLDGADITAPGGFQSVTINNDMIAETQVLTSNFTADMANGPTVMDSVTKSGTKDFHGSLYTYARTYQLNSVDALAKQLQQAKAPDRYIYPGVNLGGPLLIPGTSFNRDKRLTFFVGAEDYVQRNIFAYGSAASALVHALVPTAAMRTGDFSATQLQAYLGPKYGSSTYVNITQVPTLAKDGTPLVNGQIPLSYIDGGGQALINLMPLPNTATTSGGFNYITQNLVNSDIYELVGRIDYAISSKNTFFLRYVMEESSNTLPQTQYSAPSGSLGGFNTPGGLNVKPQDYSAVVNYTTQFTPTLVNEFFGWLTHAYSPFQPNNPALLTAGGIHYPYSGAYANQSKGYPQFGDYNYDGLPVAQPPDFSLGPLFGKTWNYGIGDNVTKVLGTHTVKVGTYLQRVSSSQNYNTFSGYSTAGGITQYYEAAKITDIDGAKYSSSGNYLANLLEGITGSFQQQNINAYGDFFFWNVDGYAQDAWRVQPRLTLTYGVRLEHLGLWDVKNPAGIAVFDPSQISNSGLPLPGFVWHGIQSNVPKSGVTSYPLFFEPRAGFAWDTLGNGKIVVRGGYGAYRSHDSNNDILPAAVTSQGVYSSAFTGNGGVTLAAVSKQNLPVGAGPTLQALAGITKGDNEEPQTKNYSLSVDYAAPHGFLLQASYVGNNSNFISNGNATAGVSLDNVNAIPLGALFKPDPVTGAPAHPISGPNGIPTMTTAQVNDYRPYPNGGKYGFLKAPTHNVYGNYNGLQVALRHQSTHLLLGVNYTFSKTLGIVGSNFAAGEGYSQMSAVDIGANYGIMPFDRTNIFNAIYAYTIGNLAHNRAAGLLVNGWMISGITNMQSGGNLQTSISYSPDFSLAGKLGANADPTQISVLNSVFLGTPDVSLQPTLTCDPRSNLGANQYVNGNCFGLPQVGQNGSYQFPYMHGPAYFRSDLTAQKSFALSAEKSIQFRIAGFNFLNHPLRSFTSSFSNQYSLNLSNFASESPGTAKYDPNSGFGVAPYKVGRRTLELSVKYAF